MEIIRTQRYAIPAGLERPASLLGRAAWRDKWPHMMELLHSRYTRLENKPGRPVRSRWPGTEMTGAEWLPAGRPTTVSTKFGIICESSPPDANQTISLPCVMLADHKLAYLKFNYTLGQREMLTCPDGS